MQKIEDQNLNPSRHLPKLNEGLAEEEEEKASENHDSGEEEEFSFDCGGADGQIKTVYPLFNQDLFFSVKDLHDSLPVKPPMKNVFVETSRQGNAGCEWSDRRAVEALASPKICKKSNSTGFSKIWRFKDLMGRSKSDGGDTFAFLNNSHAPPEAAEQSGVKADEKKRLKDKLKGKLKKGKTASLSAHEVYLKGKAKEGDQRRSYLLTGRS